MPITRLRPFYLTDLWLPFCTRENHTELLCISHGKVLIKLEDYPASKIMFPSDPNKSEIDKTSLDTELDTGKES